MSSWKLKATLKAIEVCVAVLPLASCRSGHRPFLVVQVCLRNEDDVSRFVALMRGIASQTGLHFVDTSAGAQEGLARVAPAQARIEARRKAVNIGTVDRAGFGFSAGNLGMPGYQVAVGFTDEGRSQDAHKFALATVTALRKHWRVETQSGGSGAQGMKSCR